MLKIDTQKLADYKLNKEDKLWAYCALDSTVTGELANLFPQMMEPEIAKTYSFSKSLQAPVYGMMRRGMRIDHEEIRKTLVGDPDAQYNLRDVGPGRIYATSKQAKREVLNRQRGLHNRTRLLGAKRVATKRRSDEAEPARGPIPSRRRSARVASLTSTVRISTSSTLA